jgi:ribosomal protein L16 Arg81 hydroxylase
MRPGSLAELIEPCPLDEFFSSFGKTYRYIAGQRKRFGHLLPWSTINLILRQHRLEPPRLRLTIDGEALPPSSFLERTRSRRGVEIPRLLPTELNRHLRDGATLIVDAIDEMYEPLAELAEILERTFRERIQVNAYAGWGTSRGFDLHWDDHDVLVLQISGRKRWKIYGTPRSFPLYRDIESNNEPPSEALWEGIMTDSDVLYIPRGWWHEAIALGEPTLHLTFGINNRTGIDLVTWLIDQLRAKTIFRMDLPRFSDIETQRIHADRLCDELLASWTPDILDRFFSDHDARSAPRPRLSLPWSVMPDCLPPSDDTLVRLAAGLPIACLI